MDTQLVFQDPSRIVTPLLAVFAVDITPGKTEEPLPALLTTSDALTNAAAQVLASGEFKAALGEVVLLHAPSGLRAERLLLVGLGKAKTLSVEQVRKMQRMRRETVLEAMRSADIEFRSYREETFASTTAAALQADAAVRAA